MENYCITYSNMYNDVLKLNLKIFRAEQKVTLADYISDKFEVLKTDVIKNNLISKLNNSFMSNLATRWIASGNSKFKFQKNINNLKWIKTMYYPFKDILTQNDVPGT